MTHAFEWGKLSKCHLRGKTFKEMGKWTQIYGIEKIWTRGAGLPTPGVIYMYITIIFKDHLL